MITKLLSQDQLRQKLKQAFEAGRQRGVYEVTELNVAFESDTKWPPPDLEKTIKQLLEEQ